MSTFAELAVLGQGAGVVYLLDASSDSGSTWTAYNFSTHDGRFDLASGSYDQRIIDVGDLQRGFGVNGVLAASSVAITLANTDGTVDELITSARFSYRWRLRMVLFDAATPTDYAVKTLGVFVFLDNPRRNGTSVQLQLADDSFGFAAELAIPPTPTEAFNNALDTASTEPPAPIAMGGGFIPATAATYATTDTTVKLVLCATTDTGAVDSSEMEMLYISSPDLTFNGRASERGFPVGPSARLADVSGSGALTTYPLWDVAKTASLTKDGRTWKLLYVNLYVSNLNMWLSDAGFYGKVTFPYGEFPVTASLSYFNDTLLPRMKFTALGPRWSSRTYATNGFSPIRAPDIVYDLLRYYSRGLDSSQVNATSFTAASAAFPLFSFRASYYLSSFVQDVMAQTGRGLGSRIPGVASTAKGQLQRAISELCQGGLIDVVTDWTGQFVCHVLANSFSLQTSTPTTIDETLLANVNDWIPSQGERWAPYNRVVFASNGRIVDNRPAITSWGQVLTRTINDSAIEVDEAFSGADFGIGTFGGIGTLESVIRPAVSFEYPLDAMNLELGDFIAVTWGRGASGLTAWSGTVFRVESLTLHPKRCTVTIQAIWIQDMRDANPYLLDDETLLVRSKGATSATLAVTSGLVGIQSTGTVDFDAMGVVPGDILILRDSTQAADVFTLNAAFRITAIPGTTEVEVTPTPTATIAALLDADWSIVRGATTYPTAVSDPTNYPSGGEMYGKQSEDGTFSDASAANLLQTAG